MFTGPRQNGKVEGFLLGHRILDLTDEKGALCGRILGDLGADVIKVEPPKGDLSRNLGPFYKGIPHPERSLYWCFYNANKRGITLDITSREGGRLLKELASKADVVVESLPPGRMEELGLGYAELSKLNPGIILTSITFFGQEGPYRDFKASELTLWALGGMTYLCGDTDRAPTQVSFPSAYLHGGAHAATATVMALYHREMTGEGQHIDASIQACIPWSTMNALEYWPLTGNIIRRAGAFRERPVRGTLLRERQVWRCKDGYVHFLQIGGMAGAGIMYAMVNWLDEEGLATDFLKGIKWEEFDMLYLTQEIYDKLSEPLQTLFLRHTKEELYHEAIRRRTQLYPVSTPSDIFESEQLEGREFWEEVEHPELGRTLKYPGAFAKMTECCPRMERKAPSIGEHNEEIYCKELGLGKEELSLLREGGII